MLEPGVTGVRVPCRPRVRSEFCRSLPKPNRSPKLFRPVDVEVRVVPGGARWSSIESRPAELIVEDLPLRRRCVLVGDDCPECVEPGRKTVDGWSLLKVCVDWVWAAISPWSTSSEAASDRGSREPGKGGKSAEPVAGESRRVERELLLF